MNARGGTGGPALRHQPAPASRPAHPDQDAQQDHASDHPDHHDDHHDAHDHHDADSHDAAHSDTDAPHAAHAAGPQSAAPGKFTAFSSAPMTFKRKENSISGDDKALEKRALEWMNKYLEPKDIHVDDLYSAFADSLNLIYALEARTGEVVGRYSKRPMLPVHRIDNTAVALSFLNKHNVPTQFLQAQDLLDGNKGKILALFTYILKVFP